MVAQGHCRGFGELALCDSRRLGTFYNEPRVRTAVGVDWGESHFAIGAVLAERDEGMRARSLAGSFFGIRAKIELGSVALRCLTDF